MSPLPGPSQARSKRQLRKNTFPQSRSWTGLKPEETVGLEQKIKERFGWNHTLRDFQLQAIKAQLFRKDVLIHAGTGSGKTAVAAGPFAHEKTEGMVSFMVSPLIALQEEQVLTFRDEKLRVISINSSHGGCSKEVMNEICMGQWQIVIISPEMMLSKVFIENVLKKTKIGPIILSVIVDEAHVVSHWGSEFRKQYGTLGKLRALLPKGTSFVAMSATLPPRVRKDVLSKLQFDEKNYAYLNIGNDRPNVSIVVRPIHNNINTYADLDFLIPNNITQPCQIKKTFIYADSISDGIGIENRLYACLPETLRDSGIVRPYNAAYTAPHRERLMALFKEGVIRILICTDAAGMGCNIPDIDVVVQWKLPSTVSSFVQRAGRAARRPERSGLAVLLVEKSIYNADLSKLNMNISLDMDRNLKARKKGVRQSSTYPKANKNYAIQHGVQRGDVTGAFDKTIGTCVTNLDSNSIDEGLYSLAQSTSCRRGVLTDIYGNDIPQPNVPCCDICDPSLLDQTRPGLSVVADRKKQAKKGLLNLKVQDELHEWRKSIWKRDCQFAMYGPSGILSDSTLKSLASAGPISTLAGLEQVVGKNWAWFGQYGDELLNKLISLSIPALIPKPTKRRAAAKRAREVVDIESEENPENGASLAMNGSGKRRRTDHLPTTPGTASSSRSVLHQNPTPVNHSALSAQTRTPQPQPVYQYPGYPMTPYPTTPLPSVIHPSLMYGGFYYPQATTPQ